MQVIYHGNIHTFPGKTVFDLSYFQSPLNRIHLIDRMINSTRQSQHEYMRGSL